MFRKEQLNHMTTLLETPGPTTHARSKASSQAKNSQCILSGASIHPEAMMHFPPLFNISPLFSKNFQTGKFSKFYLFPTNFPFSSAKISDDFFSHRRPQISNFPPIFLFSLFRNIPPPVSRNLIFTPYFQKFPPSFRKIHLLFT